MEFLDLYEKVEHYFVKRPFSSRRTIVYDRSDNIIEDGTFHGIKNDPDGPYLNHALIYRRSDFSNSNENLIEEIVDFWGIIPNGPEAGLLHHEKEYLKKYDLNVEIFNKKFYAVLLNMDEDFDIDYFYRSIKRSDGPPRIEIPLSGSPILRTP